MTKMIGVRRIHILVALGVVVAALLASSPFLLRLFDVEAEGYHNISASELHDMLRDKDFLLINTHVPYEGEIEGTDLFIPYNQIDRHLDDLPQERDAKIVVYCMSDRMSNIAARELVRLEYTNVVNLEGGMKSWRDRGYPIVYRQHDSTA